MDLHSYIHAIRRGWWIVLACALLGVGGAVIQIMRATPIYAGHVTFFLASSSSGATNSLSTNTMASEDLAVSYAQLLSSDRVVRDIVSASAGRLTATEVRGTISGSAKLNTVLISVTTRDSSRPRLKLITEAVARQFPKTITELNGANIKSTLSLTSGPRVGAAPVSPRRKLVIELGLLIGLFVGLALAVARELLDTRVRDAVELQNETSMPVIGNIFYDSTAKDSPLVVGAQAHSPRAEAFRQLRTNLLFVDAAGAVGVIVVTSSAELEGKSTTAVNLALVVADSGRSVLLIEADLRRPKASDYLGIERAVGLTNVLAGQVGIDDVLQEWGSESLHVLSSGTIPSNPSELLGSARMRDLLAALRGRFDLIIIDTPPLLPATDAAVLAADADGVIVIVRHGKTKRAHVRIALRSIAAVNARVLGLVLNMVPVKGPSATGYGGAYKYASTGVEELPLLTGGARVHSADPSAKDVVEPAPVNAVRSRPARSADLAN